MNVSTKIINKYLELVHSCGGDLERLGTTVAIPIFSEKTIEQLCDEYCYFSTRTAMVQIDHDVIVVGDLHGHLHNCLSIFNKFGFPPKQKYLFLGNITEFGEYSLELVILLLAYNILYPRDVYLLRGSTERIALGIFNGLQTDIDGCYKSMNVYERFMDVFNKMPACALVLSCIFCCQPETILKYESIGELLHSKEHNTILTEDEAYNHLLSVFDNKLDDEKIEKFINKSYLEFIIMGSCSDNQYFQVQGRALYISACSNEQNCVIPICQGHENEIELFEGCNPVHRIQANFFKIKDHILMSNSNKKIVIPQIGSRPQLRTTVTTPNNRGGIPPAKSMAHMTFTDFVV